MQNNNSNEQASNQQISTIMSLNQNPEISSLKGYPINIYNDLKNIKIAYVGIENDIFRIFHCQERNSLSFKVYYLDENNKVNLLFNAHEHFVPEKCCCCCSCEMMNGCCCVYLCKKRIIFQLDYLKNNKPFATLGINLNKGCYCCKINGFSNCCFCCNCKCKNVLQNLELRLNNEPNNIDFSQGRYLGISTATNKVGCGPFSNKVEITDEKNNLKWIIALINKFCNCKCLCCEEIYYFIWFFVYLIYLYKYELFYDSKKKKCGEIIVPFGCCSRKLEKDICCKACCGGCCSTQRVNPYYQIHFPKNANSLDKFYIISAVMMFEINFGVIQI